MIILNDIHVGFQRKGGTTPKTQETLRSYLFDQLANILSITGEMHLLINGDLFDDFEISPRDWVETYLLLSKWLASHNTLTLAAGNHDWSPRGNRVSSFEMLCKVLKQERPDQVTVIGIDEWDGNEEFVVLAHCSNQDIFNLKLAEVLAVLQPSMYVFLHANYDNNFAAESDHSLNVSADQARAFAAKGAKLVFAHEHQARTALDGNVIVMGNQWPTSIADCLNNDEKFYHTLSMGLLEAHTVWSRDHLTAGYGEIDWRHLFDEGVELNGFVRVVGSASSNEAAEVISAIAKFRQVSEAFIITNMVKIDGIVQAEELPASFEVAKKFDVMEFIKRHLDEDEVKAVEKLLLEEVPA